MELLFATTLQLSSTITRPGEHPTSERDMNEQSDRCPVPTTYAELKERLAGVPVFRAMEARFRRLGIMGVEREVEDRLHMLATGGVTETTTDELEQTCRDSVVALIKREVRAVASTEKFRRTCHGHAKRASTYKIDGFEVMAWTLDQLGTSLERYRNRESVYSPEGSSPRWFPVGGGYRSIEHWVFGRAKFAVPSLRKELSGREVPVGDEPDDEGRDGRDQDTVLSAAHHAGGRGAAPLDEEIAETDERARQADVASTFAVAAYDLLQNGDWWLSAEFWSLGNAAREAARNTIIDATVRALQLIVRERGRLESTRRHDKSDSDPSVTFYEKAVQFGLASAAPDLYDSDDSNVDVEARNNRYNKQKRMAPIVAFALARLVERLSDSAHFGALDTFVTEANSNELWRLVQGTVDSLGAKRTAARTALLYDAVSRVRDAPVVQRSVPWVARTVAWFEEPDAKSGLLPIEGVRRRSEHALVKNETDLSEALARSADALEWTKMRLDELLKELHS